MSTSVPSYLPSPRESRPMWNWSSVSGVIWTIVTLAIYLSVLLAVGRQVLDATRRSGRFLILSRLRTLRLLVGGSLMAIQAKAVIDLDGTSHSYSGYLLLETSNTDEVQRLLSSQSWTGMMTATPLRPSVLILKSRDTNT